MTSVLPSQPDAPLVPGTQIGGRFRIEAVAHRSGMSTVYQASDLRNQGHMVAIKEFCAATLERDERAEALAWLAREAALLSTLNNPHLPRLLAAFSEGDRHYVVMPFLAGETLEERVSRDGAQPETLVLAWGRELAGILRYLHTQDPPVVHRDLKPANVLLGRDGSLVLLDLGVARELRRGLPGTAVGTPGYAPPEQYQGLADERSDLYALGATLHRLLTAYNPDQEAPFRHPRVRSLNAEASEETEALVEGLLQIAPERRPAQVAAVLNGLSGAMRGAFARAYYPVHQMYRRTLAAFLVAIALSAALYRLYFGVPVSGGASAGFEQFDPVGGPLRVAVVFAPGVLAFLPLLHPRLHALARTHPAPRLHRNRVAKLLALTWGVPLVVWLLNLYNQRWGNLVAVPGHAIAPAGLALGAILVTLVGLLALYQDLRRLQVRVVRLRLRYLALGALLALWPISLATQAPAFGGSCYMTAAQPETQMQFAQVRALAADGLGDLFILDQNGLQERTPDAVYHILLDAYPYDDQSPLYSANAAKLQTLTLDWRNRPLLGTADGTVYRLLAPGTLRRVATVPGTFGGLAGAPDGMVYYSLPGSGGAQIYRVAPGGRPVAVQVRGQPAVWRPKGLVTDSAGNLYVADAAHHAIERIDSHGRMHRITDQLGDGNAEPALLSRDGAGNLYTIVNGTAYKVRTDGRAVALQITDALGVAIAAIGEGKGSIVYAVDTAMQNLYAIHPEGLFSVVGGTDTATLHCVLPKATARQTARGQRSLAGAYG